MRMSTVKEVTSSNGNEGNNKTYKIMVLGESTSYGFLLENRLEEAFPFLLTKKLREIKNDMAVEVTNFSYPGQISDSIKEVFSKNFSRINPDLVIFQFGVNDTNLALNPYLKLSFLGWDIPTGLQKVKVVKLLMTSMIYMSGKRRFYTKGRDGSFIYYNKKIEDHEIYNDYLEQSYSNYKEMIEVLKESKTPFLLLSYFTGPRETYNLLEAVKKDFDAHYIDLKLEKTEENKRLYADDQWHPSREGHQLIAQRIIDYLKRHFDYFF